MIAEPGFSFPDHYRLVPAEEIRSRLARLAARLEGLVEAALFQWPADLFYLTGSNQAGYLFLAPDREPLFLVRRSPERAEAESPVRVKPLDGFPSLGPALGDLLGRRPRRLGLCLDVTPYREAVGLAEQFGRPELINVTDELLDLRSVKSDWELEQMAEAGRINAQVLAQVPRLFRPGQSELALAGLILQEAMARGSQPFARARGVGAEHYSWHLVGGRNSLLTSRIEAPFGGLGTSPAFPQGPSLEPIEPGRPFVVDFSCSVRGYQVDVTRMFCWGRADRRFREAYQTLVEIESQLLQRLVPGADGAELYRLALERAEELGFGREFLGQGRARIKFVGHGVGLEISEPPFLAQDRAEILRAGQTLALELKMVLPGLGAVGLENTVAVGRSGARKLSPAGEAFIELEAAP